MNQTYLFSRSASDPRQPAPAISASVAQLMAASGAGYADNRAVRTLLSRSLTDCDLTLVKTIDSDGAGFMAISTNGLAELQDDGSPITNQEGVGPVVGRIIAGAIIARPAAGGAVYGSASLGIAGTGTVTSNGTNPVDGTTIVIGNKTYTFVSPIGVAEGNVLIGANATATLANLNSAINHSAGAGTTYVAAAAHTQVQSSVSSLVLTLTALSASTAIYNITVNATYFTSSSRVAGGVGTVMSIPYSADEQVAFFDLGGDGLPYRPSDSLSVDLTVVAGTSAASEATLILFMKV